MSLQTKEASFGTPSASRTRDLPLGGACYIHLTMGAYMKFMKVMLLWALPYFCKKTASGCQILRRQALYPAELWKNIVHFTLRTRRNVRFSRCFILP